MSSESQMLPIVSLIISTIGIIAAIWAYVKAAAASKRANTLQETVVDIEKKREDLRENERKKAYVRACIYVRVYDSNHDYYLKIKNHGEHAANDVRVYLDGGPLPDHKYSRSNKRSLPVLGSGAQYLFLMNPMMLGESPLIEVKIVWNDGFSNDVEYVTTVSL